jgi:DNA replication protein
MPFPGLPEDNSIPIRIPEQYFRQVLYDIDDLGELRLTLYVFWYLDRMQGTLSYLRLSDLTADPLLVRSVGGEPASPDQALEECLHKAVRRGTLLEADITLEDGVDKIICLNSLKGRAFIHQVQNGAGQLPDGVQRPEDLTPNRPNIFQLYEANIGPLTPMIADALREAEKTYQANWIEDAFRIAVERNKRNWHYIDAILHRWQEGGRDDRKDQQNRRDTEEARRRYSEWEN